MKILVTGAAGFIGYHLSQSLLDEGHEVTGLDNLNDYYSVQLKQDRLRQLGVESPGQGESRLVASAVYPRFGFYRADITDAAFMSRLFRDHDFDAVCHLAAQAGVRYSLENPRAYISANINGFLNILEGCRQARERGSSLTHLVFASSSSVYGLNEKVPFGESDNVDHPVSLYAATKKSNELMAHTYSHLYGLPVTGLRFFTVYGPWGRPDMSPILFSRAILEGEPIKVFNNGDMSRDFTYVDDIVKGIVGALKTPARPHPEWDGRDPDPATARAPYRIYNIGNGNPVKLMDFISLLEKTLGKTARKEFFSMQPGDVKTTWADTAALERDIGYKPETSLEKGIELFARWYKEYICKG